MIKNIIKQFLPPSVFKRIKSGYYNHKLNKALTAFQNSGTSPAYLEKQTLNELHKKYQSDTYVSYEPDALLQRGQERFEEIKKLTGEDFATIKNCFEVGCGDGMVCSVFAENGIAATAMDYDDKMFDERAKRNGVNFIVSDAAHIPLENESFDLVFSYNSFEHIMDPEKAFLECLRLLKPGGFVFITFNPLFLAPMGFHAYKSTQVPYLQVLFEKEIILEFIHENKLPEISFSYSALNNWSVSDFRKLWKKTDQMYTMVHYREIPDYYGIELIASYPSCFKSKSKLIDDFTVSGIELMFKKVS